MMVNELEWIQISHFHGVTEKAVTYRVKALIKVVYSMKYHYFIGLLHSTEKSLQTGQDYLCINHRGNKRLMHYMLSQ